MVVIIIQRGRIAVSRTAAESSAAFTNLKHGALGTDVRVHSLLPFCVTFLLLSDAL